MEQVKKLFFQNTLKRWHFNNILKNSKLSRERVNHFLKQLINQKFITRIKPKKKMPYYIANRETPKFRIEKRLYGLNKLKELFEHINSIKEIKSAILFGSYARGDWNISSDIDLFIYGNTTNFNKANFENKMNREIQLFNFENTKTLKKQLDSKLIPNIIQGFNIKGNLEPFEVRIHG